MSVERVYICDGPDCAHHARSASKSGMPAGFLRITGDGAPRHFCDWDCVLRYAARFEPTEKIPVGSDLSD